MDFRLICFALTSLSMSLTASTARADLIVEFDSIQINAGESASIDVFIRSSDGTDQFAQYNVQFFVEHRSGQGIMEFLPSTQQEDSETLADNYIFRDTSIDFQATRDDNARNELSQIGFSSVNVPVGAGIINRKLLGRLEINHSVTADQLATFAGAEYRISIVKDNGLTFFNLEDYSTPVAIDEASYTNFGTITVMAVPEPSTGLLLLSSLGALAVVRRKARRASAS